MLIASGTNLDLKSKKWLLLSKNKRVNFKEKNGQSDKQTVSNLYWHHFIDVCAGIYLVYFWFLWNFIMFCDNTDISTVYILSTKCYLCF